ALVERLLVGRTQCTDRGSREICSAEEQRRLLRILLGNSQPRDRVEAVGNAVHLAEATRQCEAFAEELACSVVVADLEQGRPKRPGRRGAGSLVPVFLGELSALSSSAIA